MLDTAVDTSIASKEQSAAELLRISVLKADLARLFTDFKSARSGFLTYFLRNNKLTKEKVKIADDTIKFINDYQGTKDGLVEALRELRLKNGTLSTEHNKFHTNLFGDKKEDKEASEHSVVEGLQGKSLLAEAFNKAIQKAEEFNLNVIRKEI